MEKLRNELKSIEKKIYLTQNKSSNILYNGNNKNDLKKMYENLIIENNELKRKIKNYSKVLEGNELNKLKNGENGNKLNNKLKMNFKKDINDIISEKEKQIIKFKEETEIKKQKEKEQFVILINKYDRTLISQERENYFLKLKLQELERQIQ